LNRKLISMLVVVLIALTAFAPLSLAATSYVGEAARVSTPIAAGQVNLRKSASMSGSVVATLPNTNPLVIQVCTRTTCPSLTPPTSRGP